MEEFKNSLKERLLFEGADAVHFGYLGELSGERFSSLPYAITIIVRLSSFITSELHEGPSKLYFHNYRTTNAILDRMSLLGAGMIERKGFRAVAIPASQTDDGENIAGAISHKMAAVHTGAGYIGKNALFISDEFGSAIRLATVLTDMPLAENTLLHRESLCGDCTICRDACPAKAIKGENYREGMPRESIFDAKACSDYMKKAYQHIGRGAVCGICIGVCPKNKIKKF